MLCWVCTQNIRSWIVTKHAVTGGGHLATFRDALWALLATESDGTTEVKSGLKAVETWLSELGLSTFYHAIVREGFLREEDFTDRDAATVDEMLEAVKMVCTPV